MRLGHTRLMIWLALVIVGALASAPRIVGSAARNWAAISVAQEGAKYEEKQSADAAPLLEGDAGSKQELLFRWAADVTGLTASLRRLWARSRLLRGDHEGVLELGWTGPGSVPDDLTLLTLATSSQALDGRLRPGTSQCEPPSSVFHMPEWVKTWGEAERQWLAGEVDQALLTYRKALSSTRAQSPTFRRYYYRIRRQWAERILQDSPMDVDALFALGASCRFLDDVTCYEDAFRRLLSAHDPGLDGNRLLALYQLGMSEMERGNQAAATHFLVEAADEGIPAPDVYLALRSLLQDANSDVSSLDLDDLGPAVRLQPEHQRTPAGWQLLGYTLMPWSDVGFDVKLEMLLFWLPPRSLSSADLPPSWFAVEEVLVQMLTAPNLAPDAGFEWIEAGDERFPYDHRAFYGYPAPVGIAIAAVEGLKSTTRNQVLRLTSRDGYRVGTNTGFIPVRQGYVYLQSVDYQTEPRACLAVGRAWYDTVRDIWATPLSQEFFMRCRQNSTWTTEAALGIPVANACAARISTISFDATGAAMADNMLFVELPDPPLGR